MTNLVIVESKSKCGKIEKILGKGYKCMASVGHIYELEKGLQAIDISNDYNPKYKIMPSKRSVVADLRRVSAHSDIIYIASDPDREGEAIALHLSEVLKKYKSKIKRVTFNEITSKAVKYAINHPRDIDIQLCDAQKARRVLDRLFGFEISPILWSNVAKNLSAGRCQSPALNIICNREDEILQFNNNQFYSLFGKLQSKNPIFPLDVKYLENIKDIESCKDKLSSLLIANFKIIDKKTKIKYSKPSPPFTTSTLQQIASNKVNINPKTTMQIAQSLYEKGFITYIRTDSTILSDDALEQIKNYIQTNFESDYLQPRIYKTKDKNSQEAHECIRPTDINNTSNDIVFDSDLEKRLYSLIWKRTVASQMTDRKLQNLILTVGVFIDDKKQFLLYYDEDLTLFQGWGCIYDLPMGSNCPLDIDSILELDNFTAEERDTKPKPRFTEASLVKELEKTGIGRPSTFSNIISTLLDRQYVIKGINSNEKVMRNVLTISKKDNKINCKSVEKSKNVNKGKLVATSLGIRVCTFLDTHFQKLLSHTLTSNIEKRLDIVALGKDDWVKVVDDFYNSFHPTVEKLKENKSDKNSKTIIATTPLYEFSTINTKYGIAYCRQEINTKKNIKYLPICTKLYPDPDKISLAQIKKLFKFPKKIKIDDGRVIEFLYGKNGFYLKNNNITMSLIGDYTIKTSPESIDIDQFLDKLENSNDDNTSGKKMCKKINQIEKYGIWEGPYGPFITMPNKRPISIPKEYEIEALTLNILNSIVSSKFKKKK